MSNDIQQVKASYEHIYTEGTIVDHPAFYRWIVTLLHPQRGGALLDVACGEGWIVSEAIRRGLRGYGLDIAEAAIAKARRNVPAGSFSTGDGAQLPFPDQTFDYVTCLGSLENMPHPRLALTELIRVTKHNGLICVMMPNAFWLGDVCAVWLRQVDDTPYQAFERRATRSAWRHFLTAEGLVIDRELRYNRPSVLFRHGKLRSFRKFAVRSVLNLMTPFNLSWSFVYLCRKTTAPRPPRAYWLWEAHQHRVSSTS